MSYGIDVFLLPRKDTFGEREFINLIREIFSEYDQEWDETRLKIEKDEKQGTLSYDTVVSGTNYSLELVIEYTANLKGKLRAMNRSYLNIGIHEMYFEDKETRAENYHAFLYLLQDAFDHLESPHGFGIHELVFNGWFNNAYLKNKGSPMDYLFPLNFFGREMVKKLDEKRLLTIPYGKVKKTRTGIIYEADKQGFIGAYDEPTEEEIEKVKEILEDKNYIPLVDIASQYLGLKSSWTEWREENRLKEE